MTSLRWTAHPFRENPKKSLLLILLLIGIVMIVEISFADELWSALSAFLLLMWLARYFFPTTYEFDERVIRIHFLGSVRERRWEQFRRYEIYKTGIHLSPFRKPNILDNFRGLFILFQNNHDEVVEFVRGKIKTNSSQRC